MRDLGRYLELKQTIFVRFGHLSLEAKPFLLDLKCTLRPLASLVYSIQLAEAPVRMATLAFDKPSAFALLHGTSYVARLAFCSV